MSAAVTAAGYLYACGRLRARVAREPEPQEQKPEKPARKLNRVAALPAQVPVRVAARQGPTLAARKTPRIEYRIRRRWSAQ